MTVKKYKLNNKYMTYEKKKAPKHSSPSATNREHADDCDIYKCFEKYGVQSMIQKTQANEFLYMDITGIPTNLDEAIIQKQKMDDYFKSQPALVRKAFGDNTEVFYQKYKNGDFEEFLKTGILSEQQINDLKENYAENNIVTLSERIRELEKQNEQITTNNKNSDSNSEV